MLADIRTIAEHEHKLIDLSLEAASDFGQYATDAVAFMATVVGGHQRKVILFAAHYAVARNAMIMAFLSVLRRHRVQSSLMMRTAIEHTSLAAYGLSEAGQAVTAKMVGEGQVFEETPAFKKAVYDWMKVTLPKSSKALKGLKDEINRWESHASIASTVPVFGWDEIAGDKIEASFFDKADLVHLHVGCLRVGMTAMQIAQCFVEVLTVSDAIRLTKNRTDFDSMIEEGNRLSEILTSLDRFSLPPEFER